MRQFHVLNLGAGMNERIGDWIMTASGVAFYPLDPRQDEIRIEDIAHALAMQCRFTGHVRRFYSVAEHSVRVSEVCDLNDALWGLLHDASEAYLIDVARPVKRMACMVPYREAEERLMQAIAERFGLAWPEPATVKHADKCMLAIEARDMMPTVWPDWREKWYPFIGDCQVTVTRPWSPDEAEERFLARFRDLTNPVAVTSRNITVAEAASILGRHAAARRKSGLRTRNADELSLIPEQLAIRADDSQPLC